MPGSVDIPKIAHRFWCGPDFTEKYRVYFRNLARLNSDYQVKFWSNPETMMPEEFENLRGFCQENNIQLIDIREHSELENFELIIRELKASMGEKDQKRKLLCYARASDLARSAILYSEGGVYTDTDTNVLKRFGTLPSKHGFLLKKRVKQHLGFWPLPTTVNFFPVEAEGYDYYFPEILYDFMASVPQHPLFKLTLEINALDYQTYASTSNTTWEQSNNKMTLLYAIVRLSGSALKWALNYLHQTGALYFDNPEALFFDAEEIAPSDYDKSYLDGFEEDEEEEKQERQGLFKFLSEIDENRLRRFPTVNHGSHPFWTQFHEFLEDGLNFDDFSIPFPCREMPPLSIGDLFPRYGSPRLESDEVVEYLANRNSDTKLPSPLLHIDFKLHPLTFEFHPTAILIDEILSGFKLPEPERKSWFSFFRKKPETQDDFPGPNGVEMQSFPLSNGDT